MRGDFKSLVQQKKQDETSESYMTWEVQSYSSHTPHKTFIFALKKQ